MYLKQSPEERCKFGDELTRRINWLPVNSGLNIFNNFYATYNIYVRFTTIILFIEYFYSACNGSYTERIYIGIIKYMYIYYNGMQH